jgi:hypothetical protein
MQEIKIRHVRTSRKEAQFATLTILPYLVLVNMTNLHNQSTEAPVAPTNIAIPGPTAAIWRMVKKPALELKEIKE